MDKDNDDGDVDYNKGDVVVATDNNNNNHNNHFIRLVIDPDVSHAVNDVICFVGKPI